MALGGAKSFTKLKKPGGAERDRTADLRSAIAALSHLSYSPVPRCRPSRLGCLGLSIPKSPSAAERAGAPKGGPPEDIGSAHERLHLALRHRVQLYIYVLIASAVLSWLVAFNVVNVRNPIVSQIGEVLYRLTEPALRPIRNILPNLGGVDLSPIVLVLLLLFASRLLHEFLPAPSTVYVR